MARKKKSETGPSVKADAPLAQARLNEVLHLRLDGAARWDICEYVRVKEVDPASPWAVAKRGRPLSESQIERYIQKADAIIRESAARLRDGAVERHLAMRQARYAAACRAGDNATALACLKDEARLLGLYPAARHEHFGEGGGPIRFIEMGGGDG